ncbi:MAG: hypothetical protein HQK88_01070 [Nitrospirae bacterium]|nr:hypothetical protein [Nitrospirota bacterium]MBF0518098.1 hypothetical protein [Nitrospirota bacterium]MBF0533905.1 hypothetical protein [Nitrospirota bacterium]MBF0615386.1 hypothetical protein [Nitrospirota bacterium]
MLNELKSNASPLWLNFIVTPFASYWGGIMRNILVSDHIFLTFIETCYSKIVFDIINFFFLLFTVVALINFFKVDRINNTYIPKLINDLVKLKKEHKFTTDELKDYFAYYTKYFVWKAITEGNKIIGYTIRPIHIHTFLKQIKKISVTISLDKDGFFDNYTTEGMD